MDNTEKLQLIRISNLQFAHPVRNIVSPADLYELIALDEIDTTSYKLTYTSILQRMLQS